MVLETGFYLALYLFGLVFAKRYLKDEMWGIVTALPTGLVFYVLVSLFYLQLGVPRSLYTLAAGLGSILMGIVALGEGPWRLSRREVFLTLSGAVTIAGVTCFLHHWNWSVVTPDSYATIVQGKALMAGELPFALRNVLFEWPIFGLIVQGFAGIAGLEFMVAFSPLLALNLFLIIGYFGICAMKVLGCDRTWGNLVLGVLLTFFAVNHTTIVQSNLVATHIINALYLLMLVGMAWLSFMEKKESLFFYTAIAAIGLSFSRLEGPITAVLFLSIVLRFVSYENRLKYLVLFGFPVLAWYLSLAFVKPLGGGQDCAFLVRKECHQIGGGVLSPIRALLTIVPLVGMSVVALFGKFSWGKWIIDRGAWILLSGIVGVVLASLVSGDARVGQSLQSIVTNWFHSGGWGFTVATLVGLVPIIFFLSPFPKFEMFAQGIVTYGAFVLALSVFRLAYRLGSFDTANRIFFHVFPLVIAFLLVSLMGQRWRARGPNPALR